VGRAFRIDARVDRQILAKISRRRPHTAALAEVMRPAPTADPIPFHDGPLRRQKSSRCAASAHPVLQTEDLENDAVDLIRPASRRNSGVADHTGPRENSLPGLVQRRGLHAAAADQRLQPAYFRNARGDAAHGTTRSLPETRATRFVLKLAKPWLFYDVPPLRKHEQLVKKPACRFSRLEA